MSTGIFHGPPGSYKSSTVMWFHLLDALRQGRIVVSNLQGLKTIEQIQTELGEVFPSTARIFRITIGSDRGIHLIRNFYQWLPIGSFLFIDEIQDVYPNDRSFKAQDYDYKGEGSFDDILPIELVEIYHKEQRTIKSNVDIDEYLDDLGESLFDERDYLRYPRTLRESFMRHRHFNWDICLATPDIKEVNSFVRSIAEVAYSHSSKDDIPISYFQRRPRILQHSPKENGLSIKKGDIVSSQKVPLDVFKLYKSTATGKTTKSGAGSSPFTLPVKFGALFIFSYFCYLVFYFFYKDDRSTDKEVIQSPVVQVPISKQDSKEVKNKSFEDISISKKSSLSLDSFAARNVGVSSIIAPNNFINLPFSASKIYLSGVVTEYISKFNVRRDYVFNIYINNEEFSVNSDDLLDIGYKIFYKKPCLVELRNSSYSHFVYCQPRKFNSPIHSNIDEKPVLLSGI